MLVVIHLQEPVERKLGSKVVRFNRNGRSCFKTAWDYMYIVPLIESLQRLLSNKLMLEEVYTLNVMSQNSVCGLCLQVLQGHQRRDGLLSDYCDGLVYKSHPLFSASANIPCLELMLYYDDAEVCNPLGSRSKKHKLGIVMYVRCAPFRSSNFYHQLYYTIQLECFPQVSI